MNKYRAYLKNEEKIVPVHSIHFGTGKIMVSYKNGNCSVNKNDYVLMQSTGIKDKNGVEIYEGDTLDVGCCHAKVMKSPGHFYTIGKGCGTFYMKELDGKSYEVIGNIYE